MGVTRVAVAISDLRPLVRDFGTSLKFNGTSSYASLGTANPFSGSFYVSMWVKWSGSTGGYQTIIAKRDSYSASGLMFSMSIATNNTMNLDTATSFVPFAYKFTVGRWTHMVWVHDKTAFTDVLYINGRSYSSNGISTMGTKITAAITIGATQSPPIDLFNGFIDEVNIGTYAATAAQVAAMYKSSVYSFGTNWTHLKCDEGSGTTLTDSSGNGNAGTLVSTTYSSDVLMRPRIAVSRRLVKDFGQCLVFDGAASYATSPLVPSTTAFSFGFWYKRLRNLGASASGDRVISWLDSSDLNGFFITQDPSSTNFVFGTANATTRYYGNTYGGTGMLDTWVHVACTFTTNSKKMYINGALNSTTTSALITAPPGGTLLTLGKKVGAATGYANFKIDELVWKNGAVWSATDVANLYAYSVPPADSLYAFDGNENDTIGANHMTLTSTSYETDKIAAGTRVAV